MNKDKERMRAKEALLDWDYLNSILRYGKDGNLYWKVSRRGINRSGKNDGIAGSRRKDRIVIYIDGVMYKAHRLVWFLLKKRWPVDEIDHIDTNPWNNRIENLRPSTQNQNQFNRGAYANNKSGYKGVHYDASRDQYIAQITVNGVHKFLGRFDTAEQAAVAYTRAAKQLHGKFARTSWRRAS